MWVIETIKYSWLVCIVISITHVVFVVLLLSHVWLFAAPWTAARQVSLPFTISQSLLKFMSVESAMPSNSLIVCHPLLLPSIFPSIGVFSNESALCFRWPSIEASASASVLPMNIQGWLSLGLTGLISLQSKELSRGFSSIKTQKHQFFSTQPSLWSTSHYPYMTTGKNHSFDYMDLCQQSDFSAF